MFYLPFVMVHFKEKKIVVGDSRRLYAVADLEGTAQEILDGMQRIAQYIQCIQVSGLTPISLEDPFQSTLLDNENKLVRKTEGRLFEEYNKMLPVALARVLAYEDAVRFAKDIGPRTPEGGVLKNKDAPGLAERVGESNFLVAQLVYEIVEEIGGLATEESRHAVVHRLNSISRLEGEFHVEGRTLCINDLQLLSTSGNVRELKVYLEQGIYKRDGELYKAFESVCATLSFGMNIADSTPGTYVANFFPHMHRYEMLRAPLSQELIVGDATSIRQYPLLLNVSDLGRIGMVCLFDGNDEKLRYVDLTTTITTMAMFCDYNARWTGNILGLVPCGMHEDRAQFEFNRNTVYHNNPVPPDNILEFCRQYDMNGRLKD